MLQLNPADIVPARLVPTPLADREEQRFSSEIVWDLRDSRVLAGTMGQEVQSPV